MALRYRACIADSTANLGPHLGALLDSGRTVGVYAGFDPTAPSLHLGHASVIVMLQRLQQLGLKPLALVGGATALVGDPTGKRDDRPLLTAEAVAVNTAGIRRCLSRAIDFSDNTPLGAVLVDNANFYRDMRVLDWLRDTGRHFRVSNMLAKDSVKARLATSGEGPSRSQLAHIAPGPPPGLSFTEFAYQIFQASDFARLHASHGVHLQVGGSDQWGNITAGVELVRRTAGAEVHGLTLPLLTAPDGRKFGKTEGNAVWLDSALTSHHAFWQYLVRTEDAQAGQLLRALTTIEEEEVQAILSQQAAMPERKPAQLLLADSVTRAFRGQDAVDAAHRCAGILYAGTAMWTGTGTASNAAAASPDTAHLPQRALLPTIRAADLVELAASGDIAAVSLHAAELEGKSATDLAVVTGLAKSKSDARRLRDSGGLYWNWERVSVKEGSWSSSREGGPGATEPRKPKLPEDFIEGRAAVLSAGKKRMAVVQIIGQ